MGAYLVGARVAELFEYGECLLPGLPGCVVLACGFLGVPELGQDVGFGAPVSDLPEDCLCLLVIADRVAGASMAMVRLGEFLEGVGVLPSITGLFEGSYCLLAQAEWRSGMLRGVRGQRRARSGTCPRSGDRKPGARLPATAGGSQWLR